MDKIGKNYVMPLSGYGGGYIKWTPDTWGVNVTIVKHPVDGPFDTLPMPADETNVRIPWKILGQMLVSRDNG